LQLASISQLSRQFISKKMNSKLSVNTSYSTFADDAKSYRRCRRPTPTQPQSDESTVLTQRPIFCAEILFTSRRLKST